MTTSTSQSFGQWLVNTLEADAASVGGAPLVALLTNWAAHAGNPLLQSADLLQFEAAAPAAGLQLEIEVEQQLLQLVIAKVQAFVAAKTAAASTTTSTAA